MSDITNLETRICPECEEITPLSVIRTVGGEYGIGYHCYCGAPAVRLSDETWSTAEQAYYALQDGAWILKRTRR